MRAIHYLSVLAVAGVLGCSAEGVDLQSAGTSYFPLSVGNRWIFQSERIDEATVPTTRTDSIVVIARTKVQGHSYYHVLGSWPGFSNGGLWVRRDDSEHVSWAQTPGRDLGVLFDFDAAVGQRWPLGGAFGDCLKSLQLLDDYAVVTTPYGRFDGVRQLGGGWIDCTDVGWAADFARGVGPVHWESISIAGPTSWLLVSATIQDDDAPLQKGARVVTGD